MSESRRSKKPKTQRLVSDVNERLGWMAGFGVITWLIIFFMVLVILILVGVHFNRHGLEREEKCDALDNTCVKGYWNHHGCELRHEKNGHKCTSPCYRPEDETESEEGHHVCQTTHDGYRECHMCVGSECLGICEEAEECPDLTNLTVEFINHVNVGPFSFGFDKSCQHNRCVYKFDVAVFPGLFNPAFGCSVNPYFHTQCLGILNVAEPFRSCLDTSTICRSAAEEVKRSITSGIEIENGLLPRQHADQDNNLVVDACLFTFKCAPATGLEQFNFFPARSVNVTNPQQIQAGSAV